ncbi:molybdopterin molybdotransferase MoeA [Loktanella sp. S4079]|uniref:molybdopterin molybdotransferase MoeA n=1 Tax=Loktanella sp. S4079 TaxID=579483 RepID=UPI0005F9DDBB|nr:gephyrin-like molybdotransferase Glp [Loktanella sp. S4079]KJZ19970.1 molybdenum cofactor biosynthesis protein MoaA [Loktanella sp. S4079]
MISVAEALDHLFALVDPLPSEQVALRSAHGRVLAADVVALRDQPPFAASAMDGYAISRADALPGAKLRIIGEAAAGHAFAGAVTPGEAVRIFTGAPMPTGTDWVVIQEDVVATGDEITLNETLEQSAYVRAAGADFTAGSRITAPRLISPADTALMAAMNAATIHVTRKPVVAIIATGDELVQPGETPRADQIIASNSYGIAALVENFGATARLLPIAKDNAPSLELALDLASDADLIVTIGGASVGDHDIVGEVAQSQGLDRAFYKIAMRPGKPLMAGRLGQAAMIGLPGNPVSAMVCAHIFLGPVIHYMLGLGAHPAPTHTAQLTNPLGANGPREHYMRARVTGHHVTVFERQDSALLSVLADANCLAVRPPHDPARKIGDEIKIIHLN